jgi:hypothetical protein
LDMPRLTNVIHRGYPFDILSYTQEVGRMGREDLSMPCTSTVVIPTSPPAPLVKKTGDLFGSQLLKVALQDDMHCRRLLIQQFLDGKAEPCTLLPGPTNLCDVCRRHSQHLPYKHIRSTFPDHLMELGLGSAYKLTIVTPI